MGRTTNHILIYMSFVTQNALINFFYIFGLVGICYSISVVLTILGLHILNYIMLVYIHYPYVKCVYLTCMILFSLLGFISTLLKFVFLIQL